MEMSENFTIRPSSPGGANPASAKMADTAHKVVDAANSTVDRMASGAHAAVDKTAEVVAGGGNARRERRATERSSGAMAGEE